MSPAFFSARIYRPQTAIEAVPGRPDVTIYRRARVDLYNPLNLSPRLWSRALPKHFPGSSGVLALVLKDYHALRNVGLPVVSGEADGID